MKLWGDGSEEVARRRPLDDSTAEELIAGRTTASTDDLARVSAFLEQLRALRDDPPPPPSPALSRMLAGDTEPVAGRGSRLVGDEPAGPGRAAPSNGSHRRTGAAAGPG
ncbi:MAG: hypothetical protein M3N11_02745, partial [Actinomycetota bacterium]|nr:hypothetical protein [Actinomycetota bacterium]